jgi:translation initiation factor 4G
MKTYFERIEKFSGNKGLDLRIRFMLIDLIDLRQNHWQARRQAEGPKKIEHVHRWEYHAILSAVPMEAMICC